MIGIETFQALSAEDMRFMDIQVPKWAKDVKFELINSSKLGLHQADLLDRWKLFLVARVENTELHYCVSELKKQSELTVGAIIEFIKAGFDTIKQRHENQTKRNLPKRTRH